LLGSFSAGSLTQLWFEKFYFLTPMPSLVDTVSYERLIWGALLTWLLLLSWAGLQAFLRVRPPAAFSRAK